MKPLRTTEAGERRFGGGDTRVSVLGTRVLLGGIMFVVFFGVVITDALLHTDIGFGCLAALAGAMGLREFYAITKRKTFPRSPSWVSAWVCGCLSLIGCRYVNILHLVARFSGRKYFSYLSFPLY